MPDFSFTASAECDRCGKYLSSSDADCENCADYESTRYHFVALGDEDDVELVWAITPIRAWAKLHERKDGDPEEILRYTLHETGAMSLHYAQMGYDVLDADELRQPELLNR